MNRWIPLNPADGSHMRFVIFFAAWFMLIPTSAYACSCVEKGLDESGKISSAYERASRIVLVRATSDSNDEITSVTHADVISVIKGAKRKSKRFTIYVGPSSSMCGIKTKIKRGDYVLLYLAENEMNSSRNPFHFCSRSRAAKNIDALSGEVRILRSLSGNN